MTHVTYIVLFFASFVTHAIEAFHLRQRNAAQLFAAIFSCAHHFLAVVQTRFLWLHGTCAAAAARPARAVGAFGRGLFAPLATIVHHRRSCHVSAGPTTGLIFDAQTHRRHQRMFLSQPPHRHPYLAASACVPRPSYHSSSVAVEQTLASSSAIYAQHRYRQTEQWHAQPVKHSPY